MGRDARKEADRVGDMNRHPTSLRVPTCYTRILLWRMTRVQTTSSKRIVQRCTSSSSWSSYPHQLPVPCHSPLPYHSYYHYSTNLSGDRINHGDGDDKFDDLIFEQTNMTRATSGTRVNSQRQQSTVRGRSRGVSFGVITSLLSRPINEGSDEAEPRTA
jgi:hypothetical protein